METVIISASRRTDLPAFYTSWLARVLKEERARVLGPYGRVYSVSLRPERVHTLVLWSKNFSPLLKNNHGILELLKKYSQLYFLFTITGLGGSLWERKVMAPEKAIEQIDYLIELAGAPRRVSVRFDPIVFWKEREKLKTNLYYFEKLAPELQRRGIKDVRFSFALWYPKAVRRARKAKINFYDPPLEEKVKYATYLAQVARTYSLTLHACAQPQEILVDGIVKSSCIDAELLSQLHPLRWSIPHRKDPSQREACGCSKSIDIGSYSLVCKHRCLYCYANPKI